MSKSQTEKFIDFVHYHYEDVPEKVETKSERVNSNEDISMSEKTLKDDDIEDKKYETKGLV